MNLLTRVGLGWYVYPTSLTTHAWLYRQPSRAASQSWGSQIYNQFVLATSKIHMGGISAHERLSACRRRPRRLAMLGMSSSPPSFNGFKQRALVGSWHLRSSTLISWALLTRLRVYTLLHIWNFICMPTGQPTHCLMPRARSGCILLGMSRRTHNYQGSYAQMEMIAVLIGLYNIINL